MEGSKNIEHLIAGLRKVNRIQWSWDTSKNIKFFNQIHSASH